MKRKLANSVLLCLAAVSLLSAGRAWSVDVTTPAPTPILTPTPVPTLSPDDILKQQIADKQSLIQQLEQQAQQYRDSIAQTTSQANTLKNQLSQINGQIKSLQYSISITQAKLDQTQLTIDDLHLSIDSTQQTIEDNQANLTNLIQTLQQLDNQTELVSLFRVDQLSDFFSQLAYMDNLQQTVIAKTGFLRTLKQNMQDTLSKSEQAKNQYSNLKSSLSAQKSIVADQQQEKTTLLTSTKNQEQAYQKMLDDTIAKQKQIEQEIEDIEAKLRQTANYGGIPNKGSHIFMVPVANGYVTQGYGNVPLRSATRKYYSFHNGIDYGSKQGIGAPIVAAADGIVKTTGNDGKYAYGKWVAVNHLNGLITLYGHMSYVNVQSGQTVKQGDVIGYMGQTGLALGPHLHFTVYLSDQFSAQSRWYGLLPVGASVDPNDYL